MKGEQALYLCPDCKGDLEAMQCYQCSFKVDWNDNVPVFFTSSPIGIRYKEIGLFYDNLYRTKQDAWKDLAGRGPEFISYMASLIESFRPKRYLEVGCGEGFLLSAVAAPEKFGMEISRKAIESAKGRATAEFCQGCVEELPYPSGYFDVVTGIGVLEHFINDVSAMKEIYRVLRNGGYCILLFYIPLPVRERIIVKLSEFLYPRFHPVRLSRWMLNKCSIWKRKEENGISSRDQVMQPVQIRYTHSSAKRLFDRAGFKLARLITKRRVPDAPIDHYFPIYVLKKPNDENLDP